MAETLLKLQWKKYNFILLNLRGALSSSFFMFHFMKNIIFILSLIILCSCSNQMTEENVDNNWSKKEFFENIEDGDIVLKMGYGSISKIIAKQLKETKEVSHCAIVCQKDSGAYLIHSISGKLGPTDGVQKISIYDFFKDIKPNSLFVLRHNSSAEKRSEISNNALILLKQGIPFDLDFGRINSSKMYCSEFVEETLKQVYRKGFFSTKKIGKGEVYTFSSLIGHEDFTLVN